MMFKMATGKKVPVLITWALCPMGGTILVFRGVFGVALGFGAIAPFKKNAFCNLGGASGLRLLNHLGGCLC